MAGEIRGDGSSKLRNAASYGFQAVNSAGDSLLRAAVAGPYSLALSSSATFNETILDASRKGASTGEAVLLGVLNAGIEYATEKIPLDNLLDNLGKNPGSWRNILLKAGGQGLIECTTEELSFIGTTLAEAAVLRQKSEYAAAVRELMDSGIPEPEAIAQANRQLLEEAKEIAIVSTLSGEMSSMGSSIIGAIRNPEIGWRGAADLAKQKNLNVMETLSEAGLQGSEALAKASTHTYAQSFQQALKDGATFDQALKQATADTAMETITWQVPLKDLLDDIKGDPKKARAEIDRALKRQGIHMTPVELQWLGAVAAEASFLQYDSNFYKKIALEMMTGMDYEEAHAVASRKAWQEASREMSVIKIPDRVPNAGETFGETQINSQELQQEYMEFNEDIEANEEIDNPEENDTIDSRGMAMSLRKPRLHILTEEEIQSVLTEVRALGIDEKLLRFNQGPRTGFSDDNVCINIRGDVLPDLDGESARDRMSIRAVLAHEYYGHYLHHPSEYPIGDWRDEFRASYEAAVKAPNLTAEDRANLMIDAYDRAREARQFLEYDETARRIIYGYEEN